MAKIKIIRHFKVQVFLKSGAELFGVSAYQPMLMQGISSHQKEYQPPYFSFSVQGHAGHTITVPMENINYILSKPVYEGDNNVPT